jgi:pilus assembly protein Flp/PilA
MVRPNFLLTREMESAMQSRLTTALKNFLEKEDGPTAVEYAVTLALIISVCMAAINALGQNTSASFSNASGALAAAGSSSNSSQQAQASASQPSGSGTASASGAGNSSGNGNAIGRTP